MTDETVQYEKNFVVEPDKTSTEIAEAFGISGGYEKNVINIELPKRLPKITYITGESGCGKSTLLDMIRDTSSEIDIPEQPLWKWGSDIDESLKFLSKVGLGDATMFVSKYEELSDSQQYRAKLYKKLLSDEKVLYFDEFLSTLDRKTAHSVAYVFQKVIRNSKKRVVLATAHSDLSEYLQPNLEVVGKAFPHEWDVTKYERDEITNPFISNLEFRWKDKEWYRECRLGELHYKGKYTGGVKDYLAAYYNGKLVGFLISIYRMHDGGRRISRLVTHPSYRSVGIGKTIVSKYLEHEPSADVVAEMAKYNPVFERAGMERVENSEVKPPSGLHTDLRELGFNHDRWYDKEYCLKFMEDTEHRKMLSEYADNFDNLITPAGDNISAEERKKKIIDEQFTAGRVLWNVRPKELAKFVGPEYE
jgi:ABC-type lipoprotein export system ATPase subunit/GNAT superfamily N-acetyltransferase